MVRTRSYRREMRAKHIKRKKAICAVVCYNTDELGNPIAGSWYKHDGQYDKGKIHCSCPLCTFGKYYGLKSLRTERELEKLKIDMRLM